MAFSVGEFYWSSCPALCRASTSFVLPVFKTWMAGTSSAKTRFALLPGHDEINIRSHK